MKKLFAYILIVIILVGIFSPTFVSAQSISNCTVTFDWGVPNMPDPTLCVQGLLLYFLYGILSLVSLLLMIAGTMMDFVVNYTIVNMRLRIDGLNGINIAWKILKDLMNIAFIFLLLYEAIKLIIGQGSRESVKKFITGIVLASLLINFSLFFTKVLIDASNIVTVGLYDATIDRSTVIVTNPTAPAFLGLSTPIMRVVGLTSFYDTGTFTTMMESAGGFWNILAIPILGIFLFIVVTFVFIAVAGMLIVRFFTLILLLILSPIAYMGLALNFMKPYSSQWWKAFNSQLIFPPVFMLMMLVSLTIAVSPGFITNGNWGEIVNGLNGSNPQLSMGTAQLLLNFIIFIGLIIASLTISKKISTDGSSHISNATSKLTGFAGGAVMGGGAWLGRRSAGYVGNSMANNVNLQEKASDNNKNIASRMLAKTALYSARTSRDATFDVRNASVPGMPNMTPIGSYMSNIAGLGKGDEKGYKQEKEDKDKKKRDKEAKNSDELAVAQAKRDIVAGSKNTASQTEIDAMEKALAKLSDKQTETLVAGNRELLNSLNFANSISVKQLEALNKSDQFSDSEKDTLKGHRFSQLASINDAAGLAAIDVRTKGTRALTPVEDAAAKVVDDARAKAKGLSDSEFEMIDSENFNTTSTDPVVKARAQEFVSQLRPAQADTIINNKGGKFSSTLRTNVKSERIRPLMDALTASPRTPAHKATIESLIKKADIKTKISYLKTKVIGGVNVGLDLDALPAYDVKTLQRMALNDDMSADDISTLRARLLASMTVSKVVKDWLTDVAKGEIDFPA